jgi:predicted GTPase
MRRNVLIMGAGGRDFHDFNVRYRNDPNVRVVAFTAAQVPGIAGRVYPPALAGALYPAGIPIWDEAELADAVRRFGVDEVVLAYSELSHGEVMHRGSTAIAAGADFTLLGPTSTMIPAHKPVVAVCSARTGSGKSLVARHIARLLRDAGLTVAVVLHPMPYGDLESGRVRRYAALAELDAAHPTNEEREEVEGHVAAGLVVFHGVDYAAVLEEAEREADVIVWDGGNNDLPFIEPTVHVVVVDPLRAGQELAYHPGEANIRLADVVLVNKADGAGAASLQRVLADVAAVNPDATVVRSASDVRLDAGPSLMNLAVLVVEDGQAIVRGGLASGAGTVAAQAAMVGMQLDPRPYAVGSIAETLEAWPHIGPVLPALGYSDRQLCELEETIDAVPCDVVVNGTSIDLGRLVRSRHPIRNVSCSLRELGAPTLHDALRPLIARLLEKDKAPV